MADKAQIEKVKLL